jgi:hypothetical protein
MSAVLDPRCTADHPELVVVSLLQHALEATRRALAHAHPHIVHDGELGDLHHDEHLALLLALHLADLDKLLTEYRDLTTALWQAHDDDLLPF